MTENRQKQRIGAYAKVKISNIPGYIRNFTQDGCKVMTFKNLPVKYGEDLVMELIPEKSSGIDPISLVVEKRWDKTEDTQFVYGFRISSFHSEEDKKRYISLISNYSLKK